MVEKLYQEPDELVHVGSFTHHEDVPIPRVEKSMTKKKKSVPPPPSTGRMHNIRALFRKASTSAVPDAEKSPATKDTVIILEE